MIDIYIKETDPDGRMYYAILSGKKVRYNRKRIPLGDIGVYKIENLINGNCYVGQSIHMQRDRLNSHKNALSKNWHRNKHLQNAFNKYGLENFTFTVLLYCEPWELERYEQGMVDALQSEYNQCKECVTSTKGMILSEESKQKMSESHKMHPMSEEHKKNLLQALIGNKNSLGFVHSEETRRKLSEVHKTENLSDETRHKLSESHKGNKALLGHVASDDTRRKLSIASKGHITSEETKHKLSLVNIGKKMSEESKRKMSEAWKKRKLVGVSDETRRKISTAMMGNQYSKGHVCTEESICKMTESHKRNRQLKQDVWECA